MLVELALDAPSRFNTICSLLLAAKLNVTCSGFDPWLPTLSETCSPPFAAFAMLMVLGLILGSTR